MKLEIELNVADDTVDKKQLEDRLRTEAVLSLFADRKIASGHASRLLGLTRIQFLELLRQRSIPHVDSMGKPLVRPVRLEEV